MQTSFRCQSLKCSLAASAFLLTVLCLFLFRSHYKRLGDLGLAAASYFLAVLLEQLDHQVYALLRVVSGHTLKHSPLPSPATGFSAY
jgi:hypothetical protein